MPIDRRTPGYYASFFLIVYRAFDRSSTRGWPSAMPFRVADLPREVFIAVYLLVVGAHQAAFLRDPPQLAKLADRYDEWRRRGEVARAVRSAADASGSVAGRPSLAWRTRRPRSEIGAQAR